MINKTLEAIIEIRLRIRFVTDSTKFVYRCGMLKKQNYIMSEGKKEEK